MKPPHSGRPGGGSSRGGPGGGPRPQGGGPGGSGQGGFRDNAQAGGKGGSHGAARGPAQGDAANRLGGRGLDGRRTDAAGAGVAHNGKREDRRREGGPGHGHGPRDQRPQPARPQGDYRGGPRGEQQHGRHGIDTPRGAVWLYGQHAVAAALANPARRLRRMLATEEAEAALASRLAGPWPVQAERVERGRLDGLLGRDTVHQGIALLADPLATPTLAHALERPGPVLVLDQVTDPRNVGAILRSAAAFGSAAVIVQDRNAPEETGALAKAASGALESVPLLRAVNIARTLVALKASNVWTVGLDASAAGSLSGPALADRRVALVLGAEGEGLRRLTRETCDEVAKLDMPGAMESLNVSAAATVALYEVTRAR